MKDPISKFAALCLTLLLGACSLEQRLIPVGETTESQALALQAPVGVQNFRQAVAVRESALGVRLPLATAYGQIAGLLSADGDSESAGGPMLVAFGTLNARYCRQWVQNQASWPSAQRQFFKSADFSAAGSRLSEAAKREATRDLFRMAFERAPSEAEEAAVFTALTEAQAEAAVPGISAAGTFQPSVASQALTLGCAAVLTSPEAVTH
jgi:hypothetical protein